MATFDGFTSEMSVQGGMYGEFFRKMKLRGWSVRIDAAHMNTSVDVKDGQHLVTMHWDTYCFKNGVAQPKEVWDKEAKEVAREMGFYEQEEKS